MSGETVAFVCIDSLEVDDKREMAVPILRVAIFYSHVFFNSLSHTVGLLSNPKKRRLIVYALLHRKSIHFGEATTLVSFESILDSEFNYYLVDFFCFMFGFFRLAFENFLKFPACRKFGVLRLTFENF